MALTAGLITPSCRRLINQSGVLKMKTKMISALLIAGALAPALFFSGIALLAAQLPDYSHVSQTVSEIGRMGSPMQTAWTVMNLAVALCFALFAIGLYGVARSVKLSPLPAYFMASFAISCAGLAWFSSPHPLHNIFGLSCLIGYFSPLVLAICWRKQASLRSLNRFSLVSFVLVLVAIGFNLAPAFSASLYPLEYYGLAQRALFVVFHGLWCLGTSYLLLSAVCFKSNALKLITTDA